MSRTWVRGVGVLGIGVVIVTVMMTRESDAGQRGFEVDPGEQVLSRSCLACHDLTPIRTQALDVQGWSDLVDTMIEDGADVQADEIPLLTNYLAGRYGPVPDGEGREILLNTCTVCHDRDRIWAHAGSGRAEWEATLLAMLNEGAFLTDSDFATLLDYLARNLGP